MNVKMLYAALGDGSPSIQTANISDMDISNLSTFEQRGSEAQAKAAQAYARLLNLAETRDSGQILKIASFLAATYYNGNPWKFDLFELRALDLDISDDMLACLNALRWGKSSLCDLVPNGDKRVQAVIEQWGFKAD